VVSSVLTYSSSLLEGKRIWVYLQSIQRKHVAGETRHNLFNHHFRFLLQRTHVKKPYILIKSFCTT